MSKMDVDKVKEAFLQISILLAELATITSQMSAKNKFFTGASTSVGSYNSLLKFESTFIDLARSGIWYTKNITINDSEKSK